MNPLRSFPENKELTAYIMGALRFSHTHEVTLALLLQEALLVWPDQERSREAGHYARQMRAALASVLALLQQADAVELAGDMTMPTTTRVKLK